jgi:hypothetical protein
VRPKGVSPNRVNVSNGPVMVPAKVCEFL